VGERRPPSASKPSGCDLALAEVPNPAPSPRAIASGFIQALPRHQQPPSRAPPEIRFSQLAREAPQTEQVILPRSKVARQLHNGWYVLPLLTTSRIRMTSLSVRLPTASQRGS
jgi:hypothetical protein